MSDALRFQEKKIKNIIIYFSKVYISKFCSKRTKQKKVVQELQTLDALKFFGSIYSTTLRSQQQYWRSNRYCYGEERIYEISR